MARRKRVVPEKVESRPISSHEKQQAVRRMEESIQLSPVLNSLGLKVVLRGAHFFLSYDSDGETLHMARVTAISGSPAFALEQKTQEGWVLYGQGTPSRIIKLLCNDNLGTFHGLGGIDQSLRIADGTTPEVVRKSTREFAYKHNNFACTLHEALHFYFDIPLEVLMEPREWYLQHALPTLLDVGRNDTRILVRFCERNDSGSGAKIIGHVLYALKRGDWWAITLENEEGQTLETAESAFKTYA